MTPLYEDFGRTLIKVDRIVKKDDKGNSYEDISREATVVECTNKDFLKKGDKVYYNPRGCVNVEALTTKKSVLLVVDNVDIYVKL